jgi:hypothetical protein
MDKWEFEIMTISLCRIALSGEGCILLLRSLVEGKSTGNYPASKQLHITAKMGLLAMASLCGFIWYSHWGQGNSGSAFQFK